MRVKFTDGDGKVRAAEVVQTGSGSWIGYSYARIEWSPYLDSEHDVMVWLGAA